MVCLNGKLYKNLGPYQLLKDSVFWEDCIVYGDYVLEKVAEGERRKADRRKWGGQWQGVDRRKWDRRIEYQAAQLRPVAAALL